MAEPEYRIQRLTRAEKAEYAHETCTCGNPVSHFAFQHGKKFGIACAFCAHRWRKDKLARAESRHKHPSVE